MVANSAENLLSLCRLYQVSGFGESSVASSVHD
jgi:hypothetical protein